MDRLTNSGTKEAKSNTTIREVLDKLAHYEDLEEQGRLVEVKEGQWLRAIDSGCRMHECSECGARVVKSFYEYTNPNKYCYRCGARMTAEEQDAEAKLAEKGGVE